MLPRLLVGLAIASAACADEHYVDEIGRVEFYEFPLQVEITRAVRAMPFEVRVTTYGGGCISQGDTALETDAGGPIVIPYDTRYMPPEDGGCTSDLRLYNHTATLQLDAPGPQPLRIRGRRVDQHLDEIVDYELLILVE